MKGLQFIFSPIYLLFFLFSFSSSVVFADDKPSVRCEYYADFVEYGNAWLPKGLSRLTKEQISKRYYHYRFEYEDDLLKRVVYSDSRGNAMSQPLEVYLPRDSIYEFHHPKEQERPFIVAKNELGQFVRKETFLDDKSTIIDVLSTNGPVLKDRLLSLFELLDNYYCKEKVTKPEQLLNRYELERNDKGHVVSKRFYHTESGNKYPVADDMGRYGVRYQCDDLGRICEELYLGENGSNILDAQGIAQRKIIYDKSGFPIRMECYDLKGHLCLNDQNWAIREMKQDDVGNAIYCAHRDINNQLCQSGYQFSILRNEYNEFGYPINLRTFDTNDQPCLSNLGVFEMKFEYINSNITVAKFYGIDGEPANCGGFFYGWIADYDQNEKQLSYSTLGKYGELIVPPNSAFATIEMIYDDQGNMIEQSFWRGPLLPTSFYGSHILKGEYDDMNNLVEITTLDTNGTRKTNDLGFAVMRIQYDSLGRTQSISVFDVNDQPAATHSGISSIIIRYDDKGQICKKITYDINGNQISSP